jgi:TonB family protein
LLELSAIDAGKEDNDEVDTYRALCQLALDRPRDAEQTLEQLVARKPLFTINDAQYSPRLVSLFHTVRKRALPGALQQLYSAAKADYESKNYSAAAERFKLLFSVLRDPDLSDQASKLTDFRELADGFLKLSEQKLAEAAPVPAPAAAVARAPVSTSAAGDAAVAPPNYYSMGDEGVRAPLVISQTFPKWTPPPSQYLRARSYSGRLELTINEQGSVETATLAQSIWPSYDHALLQASQQWRYQPAMKDGKPVKFKKILEINLDQVVVPPPRVVR